MPGGQAPEDAVLVEIFECCTFQPYAVTVAAGTVSFLVKNEDDEPHNFNIGTQRWASMAATGTLGAGASEALVIDALESGQYIFWCSISGHMNFGMSGTVTVE